MADGMMGMRMTDENTSGVLPAGAERRRRVGPLRRPEHRNESSAADPVTIELSKAQVDQVVRTAGEGGTMSVLLSALKDPKWTLAVDSDEWSYPVQMEDRRLSRSLLSGLLVLSCFSAAGGSLGIAELARRLDMNTSTTHRYVTTLLAVGLVERDPSTRRYRLAD
ncbi:MAG TPA: helix-turn-helix domain-containing protein [Solirubrobacteraceae bacterium]|jgi:hypothetical protein|nr:helix-turn-helix domain-containing protein [Solirubrobacteraceae bacterium]